MAGRRHAADGGYPYGDSDGEEAQDDDADAAAIRTALNAIPAAAEGGGGGDLPDFARSSFARSLFASAGAGGAESGAGAGAGAAAGARAAASSAAHAAAEHGGHQHGHGHTSAPAGLALQVLDSLENAESAAALTSAVSDDVDSSAALTDDVMGRLYPTSGGGGGGGSAGVSAAGRSSIGSNAMGAMGHASDGAIVYGGGGDGGGGGAAAAASAAAAAAAASSAAGRRRTPQRIGQGYSDAVQRPDTDEAQLRESYRIMALNEARALSMERTGYDPATAASDAGGGIAGAEADAADDENDGGGGRIRPRTARERPPPPKPKRGRPPPPPHPIEPPMPAAPRMALANINDKYTAEWRNVPDLCTGEVVELSGDGSSSDGGGDAAAAAAAAGGGLPASVLLERAILGDDEHLVRCLACSRGLRVHKMASLVRCAVCAGVSPATSLR